MPVYLPAINGLRVSQAYAEAMASAPITRVMVSTYEFNHPDFIDENGANEAIRIVNEYSDMSFTLESTAPMDPNATVLFTAVPCRVSGPNEGETGEAQGITLEVDGASGQIALQLNRALNSPIPVTMLERIYASDDPSGPAQLPILPMTLRNVSVGDVTVSANPTFFDPSNNSFPRTEYSKAAYGGLAAR